MLTPAITSEGMGFLSVLAFGTTLGYDHKISNNESIEFNFKPRIHIFDGDQDAIEFRNNFSYKKFIQYNFYTSSGLAVNYIKYFTSMSPNGEGDYGTLLTLGPNLSIGRRTMFTNRFFVDLGLGVAFNYPVYHQVKKERVIDLNGNDVQYYTYNETGERFYYLTHIFAFQFGYIIK